MTIEIALRGGRVIDPATGVDAVKDIFIADGRILDGPPDGSAQAKLTIDASGCIVTPGLLDMHVHIYNHGTDSGFAPDMLLPMGVTTTVDGGSTGVDNFGAFARTILSWGVPRCYSLLNASPVGIPTEHWPECIDSKFFSLARSRELMEEFPGLIKGIKIRMSDYIAGDLKLKPLEAAIVLAENLGLPLAVHTTGPPCSAEELVSLLRPGDIYAHCFNPKGSTIFDQNSKIKPAFHKARERGVIFDSSSARIHSAFPMIKSALEQGFFPDVLSTDLINASLYHPFLYGLPYVMTYYMAMGMDLPSAVRCATSAPAKVMGITDAGSLAPGSRADVAVFRMENYPLVAKDFFGNTAQIDQWLVPQLTMLKGRIVFRQMLFRTE